MKKSLLILILLLSFSKLNAKEFSNWMEEYPKNNNYIIESEVRYKWYKKELTRSIYELYNEEHLNEYDLNDYIYAEEIETNTLPELKKYREIENYKISKELDTNIFNNITLNNFNINGSFSFDGIQVFNKNTNSFVDFKLNIKYFDGEIINDLKLINQRLKYNGIEAYVKKIETISLDFINEYDINNLKINIIYRSYNNESKKMNMFLRYNDNYYTDSKEYYMNKHASDCINGYCYLTIELSEFLNSKYNINMYKYKDKLFTYNVYENIYDNNYYSYLEGYEKDINSAKVFYRYKNNEILCLNEEIFEEEIEEDEEIIGSLNNKIALNIPKKNKISYNFFLIFITVFISLSIILYLILLIYKKIISFCKK